jgi:hypothetical protein
MRWDAPEGRNSEMLRRRAGKLERTEANPTKSASSSEGIKLRSASGELSELAERYYCDPRESTSKLNHPLSNAAVSPAVVRVT